MHLAEIMWRDGVESARDGKRPHTTETIARHYAEQARLLGDRCCRAYWLAYARTLRSVR